MKTRWLASMAVVAAMAAPFASAQDLEALKADTKKQVLPLLPKLQSALQNAMKEGGPAGAIDVCKDTAPRLAAEASGATGWRVSRVSLKNRNPRLGVPDVWEARQLADLSIRAAQGEKPETLEVAEVIQEDGKPVLRYARALPVAQACLNCHGPADSLKPEVQAKLKQHYPADRATGYSLGDIRGALVVRRPL